MSITNGIYLSLNDSSYKLLLDSLSTIDTLISNFPSVEIVVLSDLNVHKKDWLGSTNGDCQSNAAEPFTISKNLTNLFAEPTYFPPVFSHKSNPSSLLSTPNHIRFPRPLL